MILLLCALPGAWAGALSRITAALPDVPAPPQGHVEWIAPSMRLNGLPMTLKTFESGLTPADVFNYYEREAARWGHNEFRRTTTAAAHVLSIRSNRYAITVEASDTVRGCQGTITVSGLPERYVASTQSRFPHPRTTRILNRQEYDDDGIEAEHLSLSSARSSGIEANAFVAELNRAGWQVVRHESAQARGVVIEAQRGAELAQLTLQPDRSGAATTAIVIVWKKS
jgi:hypothetical protein